jgi:hypothetical protein
MPIGLSIPGSRTIFQNPGRGRRQAELTRAPGRVRRQAQLLLGYCKESRCHIKLFGYKVIIFYTKSWYNKTGVFDTGCFEGRHYEFWLFWNWLIWRSGVLTLAELNFGLFETGWIGVHSQKGIEKSKNYNLKKNWNSYWIRIGEKFLATDLPEI